MSYFKLRAVGRTSILLGVASIGLIVSGCASRQERDELSNVRDLVQQRGGPEIAARDQHAEQAIAHATHELLASPLTPDSAVRVAILNSPSLQADYATLGVARADLVEAGLLNNPVFDAQLRFGQGGSGTGVEVAIVQDVLGVFQIPLRKRLARTALARAEAQVADSVLKLERDVRSAFSRVQAAARTLALRQTAAQATDAALEASMQLHEAGNIPDIELSRRSALHEEMLIELSHAEQQAATTRAELTQRLGVTSEWQDYKIAQDLAVPTGGSIDVTALEASAMSQRLDLAAARLAERSAQQSLGGTRRFRLLGHAEAGGGADRELDGEWSFGPNLVLPLPFFNHGQASIARAKAHVAETESQRAATQRKIRMEVQSAAAEVNGAMKRIEQFRDRLIPLRRKIVEQAQLQYNAMQISLFDLLLARQDEISAEINYVEALSDYWNAHSALRAAVGGKLPDALSVSTSQPTTMTAPPAESSHDHHH